MARKLKSDKVLFITTILLVALSVVMVYSASAPVALERYGRASIFLIKQGMFSLLGIALLYMLMRIDYRCYREPVFIWSCLAFVTLALVAVYFNAPVNGARRWFSVAGIGVQPSELAKLVAIFFIAALLERRMHRIDDVGYSLLPIAIVVLGLVALILPEPDFGTSMSLMLIAAVMVFAAGLNYRYIIGATLAALPVLYIVIMGSAYRRRRSVALRAPDSFGAFLALGLTTMVVMQALVNISVVLGLMPTKGIPLPFVSAGGSSLLINFVGMGILLNVSQHASEA